LEPETPLDRLAEQLGLAASMVRGNKVAWRVIRDGVDKAGLAGAQPRNYAKQRAWDVLKRLRQERREPQTADEPSQSVPSVLYPPDA
jgi:hypothetical protein